MGRGVKKRWEPAPEKAIERGMVRGRKGTDEGGKERVQIRRPHMKVKRQNDSASAWETAQKSRHRLVPDSQCGNLSKYQQCRAQ